MGAIGGKDFAKTNSGVGDVSSRAAEGIGLATLWPEGNWLYREDFEGTTPLSRWKQTPNGGAIAIDTTNAHHGNQSLKLTTAATISTPVSINKSIAFPAMPEYTKLGLDLMLYPVGTADMTLKAEYQVFWRNQHNGRFSFSVSPAQSKFVIDSTAFGAARSYTNSGADFLHDDWHNVKMVLDLTPVAANLMQYQSIAFDGNPGDLSGGPWYRSGSLPLYPGAPFYPGQLIIFTLTLTNNTAAAMSCNLDDLIVTAYEQ